MKKFNPRRTKRIKQINAFLNIFFHVKKSKESIKWEKLERILILDFTLIGDMIMLIPLLNVIRKNAPNAKIHLVCGSWGRNITESTNLIEKYYLFDGKKIESTKKMLKNRKEIKSVVKEIRKENYDIILEPRGDLRYIFFMHFLKGRRKASYNYTGGECFLTDVVVPSEQVEHLIDDKLFFLSELGCAIETEDRIPMLGKTKELLDYAEDFRKKYDIESKIILGIHPGASLPVKEWRGYADLVRTVANDFKDVFFVVFKGPNEDAAVEPIRSVLEDLQASFCISETNFDEYMKRVSVCSLVICNDSGAGHIAAAYGIPVVVIMGPCTPESCAPIGHNIVVPISKKLECKPCISRECKYGHASCIATIAVEEVYEVVKNILEGDKE